jgi:hypothetical protein
METVLGILASIAVLPIFGLLAYVWIRICTRRIPWFAQGSIQVMNMLLVLGPPVAFLGVGVRYFGAKAGLFVPDVPPTAVELVWTPLWSFAAIWLIRFAARRAEKGHRNGAR